LKDLDAAVTGVCIQLFHKIFGTRAASTVTGTCDKLKIFQ